MSEVQDGSGFFVGHRLKFRQVFSRFLRPFVCHVFESPSAEPFKIEPDVSGGKGETVVCSYDETTFMKSGRKALLSREIAILVGLFPTYIGANGFRLADQDAFAAARGEAFVATANNPSAVYYNPAGITQLEGHNLRMGLWGLRSETTFESSLGGAFENQRDRHAIPHFYYTFSPGDLPLSFGFGAFAPFGLSTRWPNDTGFRTVATQGAIEYITLNPVIAWEVQPNFSIGAGLTFNHADIDLQRGLFWPDQAYDNFKYAGDGWDVGFNLGVLWKPHEKVSLGVSYRSETAVDLEGEIEYHNSVALPPVSPAHAGIPAFPQQKVEANARFPFPSVLIIGVSLRPTSNWNLEVNVDHANWDRLGTIMIKQKQGVDPLIPANVPLTLDWKASWYYEFGATRYLGEGWSISAGYIYNENSVPDGNYSPLVADLNRHFFTIGTGYRGGRMSFDVAYQYGYGIERVVSGSALSGSGQTADGRYKYESHALAASLGWRF